MTNERLDQLSELIHDLAVEVEAVSKRVESLEVSRSVAQRRWRRHEQTWENGFAGVNGTLDELLPRVTRLEAWLNQLQAHRELIG